MLRNVRNLFSYRPKSGRYNNTTYKEAMRQLRGIVGFDFDLRKPLTPGKKSAIRKAYDELSSISAGYSSFVPIKRKRRESKTAYKKRLKETRKGFGNLHYLRGVKVSNIPEDAHTLFRNQRLIVTYRGGRDIWIKVPKKVKAGIVASGDLDPLRIFILDAMARTRCDSAGIYYATGGMGPKMQAPAIERGELTQGLQGFIYRYVGAITDESSLSAIGGIILRQEH